MISLTIMIVISKSHTHTHARTTLCKFHATRRPLWSCDQNRIRTTFAFFTRTRRLCSLIHLKSSRRGKSVNYLVVTTEFNSPPPQQVLSVQHIWQGFQRVGGGQGRHVLHALPPPAPRSIYDHIPSHTRLNSVVMLNANAIHACLVHLCFSSI